MIYINVDVETTGTNPDVHALLSIGAVAHASDEDWACLGEFSKNLDLASPPRMRRWSLETKAWWDGFPEALDKTLKDPEPGHGVMTDFASWINGLSETQKAKGKRHEAVLVAYPAVFDVGFIENYAYELIPSTWGYLRSEVLGIGAVDIQSLIMGLTGDDFSVSKKSFWPKHWTHPDLLHTHVAIEDAREQAYAFIAIMKDIRNRNELIYRDHRGR